jgi:hypothetical protein
MKRSLWIVAALFGMTGCLDDLIRSFIPVAPLDAEPGFADAGPAPDGDGVVSDHLSLTAVKPSRGPFVGGTEVTLSGSAFTPETTVRIGGKAIQVGETKVLSPVGIKVVTPAGEVGAADVEVTNGTETVRLAGAFVYDPVYLDPSSGPTAGGTRVTLLGKGTTFLAGMEILLGGKPLEDVQVVSATAMKGKTPPGPAGPADLTLGGPGAGFTIPQAYTYYSSADPKSGGMGGGPLAGTLTVAVLNWLTRKPVAGAKIIVEKDRALTWSALADTAGTAVFSDEKLLGPVTVTAGFVGYEASTLVAFDARDVTVFLMPIPKPEPGPLPPGTLSGIVEGYVLFGGPTGAGSSSWNMVPPPKTGQVRRIYVHATSPSIDWGPQDDASGVPIDDTGNGATAWPYSLTGRVGPLAVYAVAGLFSQATQVFEPYALGVARGVVVGPGEIKHVDVWVAVSLTEKVTVEIKDIPPSVSQHQVRLGISLGADGVMLRPDMQAAGDGLVQSVSFGRLPPLASQALLDGTYTVDVQLQSSSAAGLPMVRATDRLVLPTGGKIVVGGFVGPPEQVKPKPGGALEGNTLMWSASGAPASLVVTVLKQPDDTPIWRIISRGDVTLVKLPDPAAAGLPAWPAGPVVWLQWMAHLPGFSFDTYNYTHLNSAYWDRWSFDALGFQVP